MRRGYGIDESEWELIFYAPLTDNYTEVVHNVIGTNNSTNPQFDADKGLYIKARNANQCGVTFYMPQSFRDAISTNSTIRLLLDMELIEVNSIQCFAFRMDNSASITTNIQPVVFVPGTWSACFNSSRLNLPKNTQIHVWNDVWMNWSNMQSVNTTQTISTNYNEQTWSYNNTDSRTYRLQDCPYVRIGPCFRTNSSGACEVWIKNLKIYRHKG